jgi:hypothetical protein
MPSDLGFEDEDEDEEEEEEEEEELANGKRKRRASVKSSGLARAAKQVSG